MATYGNLTGYTDGPAPGSYTFELKDGRKFTAFGTEAEAFKKRLDQANANMPKPTAQVALGGAEQQGLDLSGSGIEAADFVAPQGGFSPTAFGVEQPTSAAPPPGATSAPPAQPTRPAVAQAAQKRPAPFVKYATGKGGTVVETSADIDPNNPQHGQLRIYDPGARPTKGGMVERGRTVSGGFEPSAEYLAGKRDVLEQKTAEMEKLREAQAASFEAEQNMIIDQRVRLNDQLLEDQKRQRAIDEGVKEAQAQRDAALKEYTGSKVNPQRAFAGGRNWIYAISAGLGAFGATLTKSPNYALQVIEQRVADDIKAQEAEIAIKRDGANNALADLTQKLGSQERAKIALAQVQNQMIQSELASAASREKDATKRASLEQVRLGLQEQWLDFNEQYRVSAQGDVTKSFANVPGSAGRAPGYRLPTLEEYQQYKGAAAPQLKPSETGAQGPKKAAEQVRYESTLNAVDRSLTDFVEAHGGSINPETGEITGNLSLPTDLPGPDSPDVGSAKATLAQIGNVYANMLNSGAEAGQPFKDKVTPGLGVGDATKAQLEAMAREVALRKQQQRQQSPQPVQEEPPQQ
jgi:hypothetical protein